MTLISIIQPVLYTCTLLIFAYQTQTTFFVLRSYAVSSIFVFFYKTANNSKIGFLESCFIGCMCTRSHAFLRKTFSTI
jgi:hypothetical protein